MFAVYRFDEDEGIAFIGIVGSVKKAGCFDCFDCFDCVLCFTEVEAVEAVERECDNDIGEAVEAVERECRMVEADEAVDELSRLAFFSVSVILLKYKYYLYGTTRLLGFIIP